jgi:phosphoenolpyruvate carboxykinase (ATP)
MYYYISGYTAKLAGTEEGVTTPKATFSACFGEAFLPLSPVTYSTMLGKKIKDHNVNVWLINTGWTGGGYGKGKRIRLKYTRAMISAALSGELCHVAYLQHPIFGLQMPASCPNVPDILLDPKNTWASRNAYEEQAQQLAQAFTKNFERYLHLTEPDIINSGPNVAVAVS